MGNYIVSARKYRPSTFDSVVGQHALTTTLKNAIAQGKLGHAYLFCGPRGVGKTTCARIFAKTINCLSPTPNGEACNECESCKAFNEQRSYNIHELDAASNNSVEDIRGLIEQVQIPPQIGKYKVFIIDEVHMLSSAAFNAFLKTLEEPPAHAIFILATTEKHKILPTILSRCQIYDFARITVADTIAHLRHVAELEGVKFEQEALHVIAEKADGGMRDALSIFDQVNNFTEGNITYKKVIEDLNVLDYEEYFGMTDELLACNLPAAMLRFNRILGKGFEGNYFVGGLAAHFRNLLMSRDAATLPLIDASDETRKRYHEQATRCKPQWLYRALKLCNDCDMGYRTSRNKRLLVELTLIEVGQAAAGEDDTGCGRGPIRRLKPIFKRYAATAPAPAQVAEPTPHTAKATPTVQHNKPAAPATQPQRPAAAIHRVQSLSIRALRSQYEQEQQPAQHHEQAAQQQAAPTRTATKATSFTQDDLMRQWYGYAQTLPREETAMAGRLKNMTPTLNGDWAIEVTLDNEMVREYMQRLKPKMESFLRERLHNDRITLRLIMANNDTPQRAFTRTEQLQEMLRHNRALQKLTQELQLELA